MTTVRTFFAPHTRLREPFLDAQRDYAAVDGWPDADGLTRHDLEAGDFTYLSENLRQGTFPRPGVRPGTAGMESWWCETSTDGQPEMLGRLCIRHYLVPVLHHVGGQVWFSIRPSRRGEGLGAELLRDALPRIRAHVERPTLIVAVSNTAARITIERVGGERVWERHGRVAYELETQG
ncbi:MULTISPECIES: GNAT family N-acetyltransferase [Thermomonosporaceae]|uniref:GNAT family N-acetyltransferase n=1 Tax=Thermomonosporaceae TaxID=2012 RepID=UPI00255B0C16|nr:MULTISPECIES: GNAT family N-acetyltransferase [Thermomonosporaceae]MDL4774243.1 GNAT family N-acetyltransferase [Actinomadura xylanilytica]